MCYWKYNLFMCYLEIKIVFIFIFWELVFVEFLFEYEKNGYKRRRSKNVDNFIRLLEEKFW